MKKQIDHEQGLNRQAVFLPAIRQRRTGRWLAAVLSILSLQASAQATASLQNCLGWATNAQALQSNYGYYEQIAELGEKNISADWLPSATANATYKYLSETTKIDIGGSQLPPGISLDLPTPSQHQYGATIELKQTIYDGGINKVRKHMNSIGNEANKMQIDIDMHAVKKHVCNVYLGLLLVDQQTKLLDNFAETLNQQHEQLVVAVENGASLASNLYIIEAEILKLQQEKDALTMHRSALHATLEQLTKQPIGNIEPVDGIAATQTQKDSILRPELSLLAIQKDRLEASKKLLSATRMPKAFAFGTLGYGYPGLNMFDETVHPYYLVGAGISWKLFDWKATKNAKSIATLQQNIIDSKATQFTDAVEIQLENLTGDIASFEKQLACDELLIELRKKISKTLKVQHENGTATSSQFVTELNKEKDAVLQKELHSIRLQKARIEYLLATGAL